ncbi:MAG TPA: ATP-binding protein [Terriglobales bacterium]|nr:ATP-binding protein [Terriglobales bacterium]
MSLRWRLLLIFGSIVVGTVVVISYVVSAGARRAFHSFEDQQTEAIKNQFENEFALQGKNLNLRAQAIARSQAVRDMAMALSTPGGDPAPYLTLASSLASQQQLDYLDLFGPEGAIISSAEWQARFGVHESWITEVPNWDQQSYFLHEQETAEGKNLALVDVKQVPGVDRNFYVLAGRRIDSAFLKNLSEVLPGNTKLLLWQPEGSSSGDLQDASGAIPVPDDLKSVLEQAHNGNKEARGHVRLNSTSYAVRAIPRSGRESRTLAVIVIASSQAELSDLQTRIRTTALLIALAGVVLSIIASGWWAGRISRPIEDLTAAAEDVAAGNWGRKVDDAGANNDEVARLIASFNQMTGELLRQRDRAVQAERVAAWRELARRLAHELKNPLFPLQITVENLMKARQQNSPEFNDIFAESTTTLLAELNNLKKIVGRFSDFSKMPAPRLQAVSVNQLLEEIARLFAPQLSSAANPIKLETNFSSFDTTISGDPDLLRRAFENLVLNAIDVMPKGGMLRIATSAKGGIVAVEISDTGAGLTEEEAKRLFTPYYTTKQHGTGLGLAIVQSVISDHGASIAVSSIPGKGTKFRIEFQSASVEPVAPSRVLGGSTKM